MPVLSITVTTEVIQHANNLIQEGRGAMVLARVADRWELLPYTTLIAISWFELPATGELGDGTE